MKGPADETVGPRFEVDLLKKARDRTLAVLLEAAALVGPGMTEAEARSGLDAIQKKSGGEKSWHPPQIRFGENTLLPFGAPGAGGVRLKDDDIYFFDIGPIFDGHEGDVGRPFAVGVDPERHRCCRDAEAIWHQVRGHWKGNGVSGGDLYEFARTQAESRGWQLSLQKANGHRIADFPHAARARGSIEGFERAPAPNRWILEIQIRHPTEAYGAFYEDLLN